jgi:predicted DNA-binding transcriptional regulator AlpA
MQLISTRGAEMQKMMTIKEVAEVTGVPLQTWRGWLCKGIAPVQPVKLNGNLRWRRREIEALVEGEEKIRRGPGRPTKEETLKKKRQEAA